MKKKLMIVVVIFVVCLLIILALAFGGMISKPSEKLKARIIASTLFAITNESIQFDGSKSSGDIVSYMWDFGDNQTGIGQNLTHVFIQSKYYNVSLTIKDKSGKTDTAIQNISIQNVDSHEEKSGVDIYQGLFGINDNDRLSFIVLNGIMKPTIYANWSGNAKLADIMIELGSEPRNILYSDRIYVTNGEFNINVVINPSDIEESGTYYMNIWCYHGKVDNYFMEANVHY